MSRRKTTILITVFMTIWATSWQNQQNGMCAQLRHRSAWASAQSYQSLLSTWKKLGSLATHWVHSKDYQTGWMPKLIRVFAAAAAWQNQKMTCQAVHQATQIRLDIHSVSSEASLCIQWVAKDPRFLTGTAKTLIILSVCPGWSESSLGWHIILLVLLCGGSNITPSVTCLSSCITWDFNRVTLRSSNLSWEFSCTNWLYKDLKRDKTWCIWYELSNVKKAE